MYKIVFSCGKRSITIEDNWPDDMIENFLKEGLDLIVISTYSNTIKIPYFEKDSYESSKIIVKWKEYQFSDYPSQGPDGYLNYFLSK